MYACLDRTFKCLAYRHACGVRIMMVIVQAARDGIPRHFLFGVHVISNAWVVTVSSQLVSSSLRKRGSPGHARNHRAVDHFRPYEDCRDARSSGQRLTVYTYFEVCTEVYGIRGRLHTQKKDTHPLSVPVNFKIF